MFAHLGPMLGPSWADVGASWGYVGASWGYVGRSCAMLVQKHVDCHRAKKHCKLQGVLSTRAPHREVRGRGPNMSAHLLAYVGLSCGQRGPSLELCWPSLGLCWPILKAMWADLEAYVGRSWGLCWPMLTRVEPKDPKMGTAKKHCKTQDILRVGGRSWGYVGPSWGYVGPSWGYVGPAWGYVGPSWSYVGPSWGYVGPSWGLCCPILRLCWPILRPMLAHVDPSWATGSEKWEKNATSTKHCKTRGFLATRGGGEWVGGRGRGPSLLRRGENCRTARTRPGGPWPDLWGLRLTAGRRQKQTREPELVLLLVVVVVLLLTDVGPIWAQVCPCLGVLLLLLLFTDVGPIWAQVCPCLGPRLLLLWLLLLSLSSLVFVVVVVVFGRRFAPDLALGCGGCCCCWPMLALFGRSFAPVLALGWPM